MNNYLQFILIISLIAVFIVPFITLSQFGLNNLKALGCYIKIGKSNFTNILVIILGVISVSCSAPASGEKPPPTAFFVAETSPVKIEPEQSDEVTDQFVFLTQKPDPDSDERAVMEGLIKGELISSQNNCVMLKTMRNVRYLGIWPPNYTLKIEQEDRIAIVDENGTTIAHIGDIIQVSGGQVPEHFAKSVSVQPIPQKCVAYHYYLIGEFLGLEDKSN